MLARVAPPPVDPCLLLMRLCDCADPRRDAWHDAWCDATRARPLSRSTPQRQAPARSPFQALLDETFAAARSDSPANPAPMEPTGPLDDINHVGVFVDVFA